MRATKSAIVLAGIGVLGTCLAAMAASAPPISYTMDQAAQGRFAYYQHCAECHAGNLGGIIGPALAGPDGNLQWESGQYVYGYMTAQMPHGNPGGLSTAQYVSIMAFLYEQHHHAAGTKPLTAKAVKADTAPMGL